MSKEKTNTIYIDVDKLKEEFTKRGISIKDAGRQMGRSEKYIFNKFVNGALSPADAKIIAALFGINPVTYVIDEPKIMKPQVVVGKGSIADTDKIISYICDVGKILTDILRETKEMRDDIKALLTAINTNVIDTTSELHQASEAIRNHGVATNQNMNKIHNLMKYGGK